MALLRLLSACFALAGLFHLAALAQPAIAEPSPPWRHALFVAINALVAWGFWRRPRGFALAFSLLTLQQLYSHGRYALGLWQTEGRLDWASVLVLLSLPLIAFLLYQQPKQV